MIRKIALMIYVIQHTIEHTTNFITRQFSRLPLAATLAYLTALTLFSAGQDTAAILVAIGGLILHQ